MSASQHNKEYSDQFILAYSEDPEHWPPNTFRRTDRNAFKQFGKPWTWSPNMFRCMVIIISGRFYQEVFIKQIEFAKLDLDQGVSKRLELPWPRFPDVLGSILAAIRAGGWQIFLRESQVRWSKWSCYVIGSRSSTEFASRTLHHDSPIRWNLTKKLLSFKK